MAGRPHQRAGLVVAVFISIHVWLVVAGMTLAPGIGFHDLSFYQDWVDGGLSGRGWPVVDMAWVYPVLALVPMLVPAAVPSIAYVVAWCAMITSLDVCAAALLLRRRAGVRAVWWWSAFLLLLGPVAIARLDAFVVPLAVVGLLVAADRPVAASLLLTAAAWIKVAPAALLLPLLAVTRSWWRRVVVPACTLSAGLIAATLALGAGGRVFSFLAEQRGRGLQIEAPAGTPWLLDALVSHQSAPFANSALNTWEITGPGTPVAVEALGIALPAALLALGGLLAWRSVGQGSAANADLLVRGALLATLTTLVFNTVGSPQFMCWLAAPVLVALALGLARWRGLAAGVLAVAGATQVFFPWFYSAIPEGGVGPTLVLAARNVFVVVLWVAVLMQVTRHGAPGRRHREPTKPCRVGGK